MPKRVIDGDAMWTSDKLAACSLETRREYPWFYPLADAYGNFEVTNTRAIWARVAATLREDLTPERIGEILSEFETKSLLVVWEEHGRRFAHWTGSDRRGRLPGISRRRGHHEESSGGTLPASLHDSLYALNGSHRVANGSHQVANRKPMASHQVAVVGTTTAKANKLKCQEPKCAAESAELASTKSAEWGGRGGSGSYQEGKDPKSKAEQQASKREARSKKEAHEPKCAAESGNWLLSTSQGAIVAGKAVSASRRPIPESCQTTELEPYQQAMEFAAKEFHKVFGRDPDWDHRQVGELINLFERGRGLGQHEFQRRWNHYMASDEAFTRKQGGSLGYFCRHFDRFIHAPASNTAKTREASSAKAIARAFGARR